MEKYIDYAHSLFDGRLNKKEYRHAIFLSWCTFALYSVVFNFFETNYPGNKVFDFFGVIFTWVIIFLIWSFNIRRYKDLKNPSSPKFFCFFAFLGSPVLMIKKGDENKNKYGDVPQKRSLFNAMFNLKNK